MSKVTKEQWKQNHISKSNANIYNRKGVADKEDFYINPEDLKAHAIETQTKGECTNEFACDLILIHDKILKLPSFRNYSQDVKDEMKSSSLFRWLKTGIKSMKPENPRLFSYITHGTILNFLGVIKNLKKEVEQRKEMMKRTYHAVLTQYGISSNSNLPKYLQNQINELFKED